MGGENGLLKHLLSVGHFFRHLESKDRERGGEKKRHLKVGL